MADNVLVESRKYFIIITSVVLILKVVCMNAAPSAQDTPIKTLVPRSRVASNWRYKYLQKLLSGYDLRHNSLRKDIAAVKNSIAMKTNQEDIPITLNLCDISISWRNLLKETEEKSNLSTGYTVGLMQDEEYVYYNMLIGRSKDSFRFSDLTNGIVYKGFITFLNSSYKVHHFIRGYELYGKESKKDNTFEFELQTPRIIEDDNLHEQLTKLSSEKSSTESNQVEIEAINLKVRFTKKIEKLGYLLEVSKYSLTRSKNATTFLVATPSQIIQLLPPIKIITLSNLNRNELVRVTLKKISSVTENGDILMENINYVNIYTGTLSKKPDKKMTDLMRSASSPISGSESAENETSTEEPTSAARPSSDFVDFASGLTQNFGDLFSSILRPNSGRRNSVRCYANGNVFEGFACRNSDICIPIEWQCDGEEDCANGDDEFRCGATSDHFFNSNHNYYIRGQCRRHEFRCRSRGQTLCLPNSWLCDGRVDCEDGWDEDEYNCGDHYSLHTPGHTTNFYTNNYNRDCADSWFNCWDNRDCIHPRYVCDNEDDCRDGSDEKICSSWNRQCDTHYEFRCSSVSGSPSSYTNRACIPKSWICDDQNDCPRGEDESPRICRDYYRDQPSLGTNRPQQLQKLTPLTASQQPSAEDNRIKLHNQL